MIDRLACTPGTIVVVNGKVISDNVAMGVKKNGMFCFKHDSDGHKIGNAEYEAGEGIQFEVLSKPKRGKNGNTVKFKLVGDPTHTTLETYWCVFKHKVDIVPVKVPVAGIELYQLK